MTEFPDENGRFLCLEQTEQEIYIVECDEKPQQQTFSTSPSSTLSQHFSNYWRNSLATR